MFKRNYKVMHLDVMGRKIYELPKLIYNRNQIIKTDQMWLELFLKFLLDFVNVLISQLVPNCVDLVLVRSPLEYEYSRGASPTARLCAARRRDVIFPFSLEWRRGRCISPVGTRPDRVRLPV